MTRTITQGDKRSLRRIIRKHIVRSDRDFGMLRTEYIERVEVDDMAADLVEWADRRALRTAPVPAPSVVSDAAGLGDRIAVLSARLAAVGFPACTCHPGDDDSERCLPRPQDWRAEIERAALSSTTLTAAPSVVPEAAVEAGARAMQAENTPRPDPLNRDQREEQDDATIATYRTLTRAALTAAILAALPKETDHA